MESTQQGFSSTTVYRDGKHLVVPRNAALPASCVKCGQPAPGAPVKSNYSWHSPWLFLLIFLGVLIYIIAALLVRRQMTLLVPLCEEHRRLHQRRRWIGIGLLLGFIPGGVLVGSVVAGGWGWLVGFALLVAALVYLQRANLLAAKRISDQEGIFSGVGEAFLSQLPSSSQLLAR